MIVQENKFYGFLSSQFSIHKPNFKNSFLLWDVQFKDNKNVWFGNEILKRHKIISDQFIVDNVMKSILEKDYEKYIKV